MKRALGGRDALGGCGSDDRSGCGHEFTQPSRGAADSAPMKRLAHGGRTPGRRHRRRRACSASRPAGTIAAWQASLVSQVDDEMLRRLQKEQRELTELAMDNHVDIEPVLRDGTRLDVLGGGS